MLVHGSTRRFRAALVTRLLLLCIPALVAIAASAQPASAFQDCPTTTPHIGPNWVTSFPTGGVGSAQYNLEKRGGVTLCKGMGAIGERRAYVQIVDLLDGADLRLSSSHASPQTPPASGGDWLFTKRTAFDICNDQSSGLPVCDTTPNCDDWFSATNASFFTDTSNPTTKLSLPEKTTNTIQSLGAAINGWFDPNPDPAWNAVKKKLTLGAPWQNPQAVSISSFPMHYTSQDVDAAFAGAYGGTVAFDPLYLVPGSEVSARRTMLGLGGSKVYILTSLTAFTLQQAQDILRAFGSTIEIQLDGGGSTQLFSRFGFFPASPVERAVPDQLMVQLGPSCW